MLALPTEEAKGLRAVAGGPAALSLVALGAVGTASLPQRCLARVRAGENRCKLEKHPKSDPSWAAGSSGLPARNS